MFIKPLKFLVLSVGVPLLAGCIMGPDYEKPDAELNTDWHSMLEGGLASEPLSTTPWWQTLEDPILAQLIEQAEEKNLDLKTAEARIREARAARDVVAADRLPQLGADSTYTQAQGPGEIDPQLRRQDVFAAGFDAAWELDIFGGIARATEAAEATVEAEIERLRSTFVSLAAEVAINYIDYRTAQARLDIAERNIEAQAETVRLTRTRFQAGLSSEFDAVRAEAQLAAFESQPPLLRVQRDTALHRLATLMDTPNAELAELLTPEKPLPEAPAEVPVGLPSTLLQRRPDIRAAERQLAAATARIGEAVAAQFPQFSLTGSFGIQALGLSPDMLDRENRVWSLGPGVRFPIFQGGRLEANIEVQNARQEQALHRYEQSILLALEEVENGLVTFVREQERHASLEKALASNQRAVRLANERYTKGLEDFLSVLTAQAQVFDTEDQLLRSQANVLVHLISLYKSLGGGWESADLIPPVPAPPEYPDPYKPRGEDTTTISGTQRKSSVSIGS